MTAALLTQQDTADFQSFLDHVEHETTQQQGPRMSSNANSNQHHQPFRQQQQPLEGLDDVVRQRMAQQAADLKAWMANKSTPPPSSTMLASSSSSSSAPLPPQAATWNAPLTSRLPPPPTPSTSNLLPHVPAAPSNGGVVWDMDSSMSAMERMRQAELKAGYHRATTGRRFNSAATSTTTSRSPNTSAISPDQVHNVPVSQPMPIPMPTSTPVPPAPTTNKRSNSTRKAAAAASTSASTSNSNNNGKPALLSDAQKRANHIQSEQRRRAAIREGYDGLCQTVPTLRAAVEDLESRKRGGKRKHGVLMGGIEVGGEKIDGRAGPKSEAVVLSKSVEYMRELLDERQALLGRLANAHEACRIRGVDVPAPSRIWETPWSALSEQVRAGQHASSRGDGGDGEEEEEEDDEMWTDQE